MDNQKIKDDLNGRFREPLPEFYKRRIIFWYDDDGEFKEEIESLELENAKVLVVSNNNMFSSKKMLATDDVTSNFLVYRPFSVSDDDNWLLNVELYSEEYRSDLVSSHLSEMNIASTPTFRKCVKEYNKFFNSKERRKKFAVIVERNKVSSQSQMHLAVMATISGALDFHPNSILKAVLSGGLYDNSVYAEIVNFGADKAFIAMVQQATGYYSEAVDVKNLAIHIMLTATTRTMSEPNLIGLEQFISIKHQSYCYDFVAEWLHSNDNNLLFDVAREVEDEVRLQKRFSNVDYKELVETECFPCINECILKQIMSNISDHLIEVDEIRQVVEKRRSMVWADKVQNYYEAILQVANMQAFYKEHSASFNVAETKKLWKSYTEEFYKMDNFYRLYHVAFVRSLTDSYIELDDLLKHVTEVVEGLYSNWFLGKLGASWSNATEDELRENGALYDIPKQVDFYKDKVKRSDTKVFVIISDALRYEVAVSLNEQLKRETQAKVELKSMQGIFPTITKFGMAALLPHKELTAEVRNDKLTVFADGTFTESTYRDKILKSHNADSVAVKYADIIKMKRAERSEIVKGKEVVYIYHDVIDEASHSSDTAVFGACDDCITELKNLVRIIVNDFSGSKILITSDHGFLYTYNPLRENDKADKSSFKDKDIEFGRRYAILEKDTNPDYLMPVKFMNDEFDGYAPRESIRIKLNGGGLNFVHGGTSLQEMVVPLIEYYPLRNSSKEYLRNKDKYDTEPVSLNLLSSSKKISNLIFALTFFQKEAVCDNRKPATYLLYFTDENGNQISDTQKVIADKLSNNEQERTFRVSFNLKSLTYDKTAKYYLVIADDSGLLAPQREEFNIDIAFAVEEFNFFD